ncbi:hypothetical protein [Actinacidiphila sp. bgisy160]|uniref:hypothetical protein n=1 Tax=Actinacidiphila sp. bgisy160 TaxID=3413796 RepID=UPI003D75D738
MTLAELRAFIAAAADLPGETPVVLSSDAEGNRYALADDVAFGLYLAEDAHTGEHYSPQDREAAPRDAVPAVFLWPA